MLPVTHASVTTAPMNRDHAPAIEFIVRGVAIRDGHVLVCRNVKSGYAYLPGGHIEFGESASVALAREMLEETGLRVEVGSCIAAGECAFVQKAVPRHELNTVFRMKMPASLALPGAGNGLPAVPSLEAAISFEWVPLTAIDATDLRPAWMKAIVHQAANPGTAAFPWLSHMG